MKLASRIKRGQLIVNLPVVLIIFVPSLVCLLLEKNNSVSNADSKLLLVLFVAIIFAWVWWSVSIVKWRYWAISDLDRKTAFELYNRAVDAKLIWPRESVFNKTEIWTKKDKRNWDSLDIEVQRIFSNSTDK